MIPISIKMKIIHKQVIITDLMKKEIIFDTKKLVSVLPFLMPVFEKLITSENSLLKLPASLESSIIKMHEMNMSKINAKTDDNLGDWLNNM